jgi:hypothetical protein
VTAAPGDTGPGEASKESLASTGTVATAVLLPAALAAVSVYAVVAPGATVRLVPVTAPMPWSMEIEVAPVTVQLSVLDPPRSIGVALKVAMTGFDSTVTVALAVTLPETFEAVMV